MRKSLFSGLLITLALTCGPANADQPDQETSMKRTTRAQHSATTNAPCATDLAAPHKGNGGFVRGPGADARGGTGNVGRNTGNGGTAIGARADASGGDDNIADPTECGTRAPRLGNGGTATGAGANASGGSRNIVKF